LLQFNCSPICEASYRLLKLFDHVLSFYSAVKDWAVSALAENFLVQRTLAALALDPEITVILFVKFELLFTFDVNLLHALAAVVTDDVLLWFQEIFAAETCFLYDSKLKDACSSSTF
jgi:hypothetical protein